MSMLGRLENWVLGESSAEGDPFAGDLRVETPSCVGHGPSCLIRPEASRLIASGGDDEFGSLVYEHRDPVTGLWYRTCLVYFADSGRVRQAYVQSSSVPSPQERNSTV